MQLIKTLCAVFAVSTATFAQEDPTPWAQDIDAFMAVLKAEHDNPYFHTSVEDFDVAIANYKSALPQMTRAERIAGFARIVALVGDGHTWMPMYRLPFDGLPPGPTFKNLPIRFELFDDGLFVVGATEQYQSLLGSRVLRFGDTPTEDAVARTMDLLPSDATNFSREFVAEWLSKHDLLRALSLTDANTLSLTVSRNGEHKQISNIGPLERSGEIDWIFSMDTGPSDAATWEVATQNYPFWLTPIEGLSRVSELDGATYFQLSQIRNAPDRSFAQQAQQVLSTAASNNNPALILDLRRCMGGNGNLNQGLIDAIRAQPEINQQGRLIVLTGRATHSAAIMLVSALEAQTEAIFVGQPTADRPNHYGETNIFVTPNTGLPIIHASEYYQTSSASDQRLFREPDVFVPYTSQDYLSGEDSVLKAALDQIRKATRP